MACVEMKQSRKTKPKVAVSLDVLVRVEQNGFSTSVYHKVDDFSFPVVLYTLASQGISKHCNVSSDSKL